MQTAIKDKDFSIGILSIATNSYLGYWQSMVRSLLQEVGNIQSVHLYLFTDSVREAEVFVSQLNILQVTIIEIPSYAWPEATLYRYSIYSKYEELFKNDILMHLDADMIINSDFILRVKDLFANSGMALVSHPGFWRPNRPISILRLYLTQPKKLYSDIKMKVFMGGLGSWEVNILSSAYVPRINRLTYVCGGTWLGTRKEFIDLVKELEDSVKNDELKGIVAIWHDESHLNKWASRNSYIRLTPEFCFDGSYPQLRGMTPLITAVDKTMEPK